MRRLPGVRLLLVEDNPINQQLARELLEMEGAEISVADNGRIALDVLKEAGMDHFDAVLLDLQMPEMDGYEAAERLRKMPGNERLPVIAMTAHAMAGERERCLALGFQDHIAKPIDPELLVSRLMHWIGPDRLAQAAVHACTDPKAVRSTQGITPFPGIDIEAALSRCRGNPELLRDLLRMFGKNYHDASARMKAHCAAGELNKAVQLAHTIKGAAANLAMHDLASAAGALEHALKTMTATEGTHARQH